MKLRRLIFAKSPTTETSSVGDVKTSIHKLKKLTKAKEKEFFKLIKDTDHNHSFKIETMLNEFPVIANSVVSGMAKGIDGYSALMLAISWYNFDIAKILVHHGSNVNFIDSSDVRLNHHPLFFDLILTIRNLIDRKKYIQAEKGFELWDLMDTNKLDYSLKSITNDGVNQPQNCIETFIRIVGANYRNKHMVHCESKYDPPIHYDPIYRFSSESRNLEMERNYTRMVKRIIDRTDEKLVKEVDANRFRPVSSSIIPFYIENGFVDSYALLITNKIVKAKYGYELTNIYDINYLKRLDEKINGFINGHPDIINM